MDNIKDYIFKFLRLENLVNHLSGYVEARIALVKLEIKEELAQVVVKGIIALFLFLVGFLFVLFMSIGAARLLNFYFAHEFGGYFVVGGFYGLIFIVLLVFRKTLLLAFEKQWVEMIKKKER